MSVLNSNNTGRVLTVDEGRAFFVHVYHSRGHEVQLDDGKIHLLNLLELPNPDKEPGMMITCKAKTADGHRCANTIDKDVLVGGLQRLCKLSERSYLSKQDLSAGEDRLIADLKSIAANFCCKRWHRNDATKIHGVAVVKWLPHIKAWFADRIDLAAEAAAAAVAATAAATAMTAEVVTTTVEEGNAAGGQVSTPAPVIRNAVINTNAAGNSAEANTHEYVMHGNDVVANGTGKAMIHKITASLDKINLRLAEIDSLIMTLVTEESKLHARGSKLTQLRALAAEVDTESC